MKKPVAVSTAARPWRSFADGYAVAQAAEVVGGGKARRARSDDKYVPSSRSCGWIKRPSLPDRFVA